MMQPTATSPNSAIRCVDKQKELLPPPGTVVAFSMISVSGTKLTYLLTRSTIQFV